MKFQTSSYNKAIIKNSLKRFGFISVLYFIITFLIVNFGMILNMMKNEDHMSNLYFMIPSAWDVFIIFFIPVVMGVILYRYIQDEKALASLHSFPVSRRSLYGSNAITFLLIYGTPIILNGLISLILLMIKGYPIGEVALHMLIYMVGMIISGSAIFAITIMFGMLVGSSVLQVVLTYVMMAMPVAIVEFSKILISWTLKGFASTYNEDALHLIMTPYYTVARMLDTQNTEFLIKGFTTLTLYLIISTILSYVLYHKRELERHHDLIAFDFAKVGFIGLLTTLITLVLANMLGAMFYDNQSLGVYVGVFFGALIGYGVTKMIAEKTVNVFKFYKTWIAVVALAMFALVIVDFDFLGYETKIPDGEDIAFVLYSENDNLSYSDAMKKPKLYGTEGNFTLMFDDPEGIQMVRNLHEGAIVTDRASENYSTNVYQIQIIYRLKNGNKLTRRYESIVPMEELTALHESKSYKDVRLKDMRQLLTNGKAQNMNMYGGLGGNVQLTQAQANSLYEVFAIDYRNMTYQEEMSYHQLANIDISTLVKDNREKDPDYALTQYNSIMIGPSYENTKKWMENEGLTNFIPVREGIVSARITPAVYDYSMPVDPYVNSKETSAKFPYDSTIGITDQAIIDQIYALPYDYTGELSTSYNIILTYQDYREYRYRVASIPENLKAYVSQY